MTLSEVKQCIEGWGVEDYLLTEDNGQIVSGVLYFHGSVLKFVVEEAEYETVH